VVRAASSMVSRIGCHHRSVPSNIAPAQLDAATP
jgi:hypothetical protein